MRRLAKLFGTSGKSRPARRRVQARPSVEALEDRLLMSSSPGTGEFITYRLASGGVFRLAATPGAQPENISQELNRLSAGTQDDNLNISPDGGWLALTTDRFGADGWSALAVVKSDLSAGDAVRINGDLIHPEGISAIASGGNLVVYCDGNGPHTRDLWAVHRTSGSWSTPVLLTAASPYDFNSWPVISADGTQVLFDAGNQPDGGQGTAIAEVSTTGANFHVVVDPAHTPGLPSSGTAHSPAFAPDGSIVLEGDWGAEQIYRLAPGARTPTLVNASFNNDNSPAALPDGRIVSLWLERDGNQNGAHEIKIMNPDGSNATMLLINQDVLDIGMGAGGGASVVRTSTVQFSAASYSAGEKAGTVLITVTRTGDVSRPATVRYSTADGTARAGTNYRATSGILSFAAGQTSKSFTVSLLDDRVVNGDTTLTVSLTNPQGVTLGSASSATLTIVEGDTAVQFSARSFSAGEQDGTARISVTRTGDVSRPATVHYATRDGTARAGTNYRATNGTLSFAAGQTSASFTIPLLDDGMVNGDKTLTVSLSNPTGATLGSASSATLTVVEGDTPPISVAFQSTTGSGLETVAQPIVQVALSAPARQTVTVRYAATGGTAAGNGVEYRLDPGTLTFNPGETSKTLPLTIVDDQRVESNDTIQVTLSAPTAATLGSNRAFTYTIIDTDQPASTSGPNILLTPNVLAKLRSEAAQDTPQWQAFKDRLDRNLGVIIADDIGSYQGEQLTYISDYALGYQVLKDSDPRTAADYADKAIALMKSGLRDYQKGSWVARQFLARGDGRTTTFTLPNADLLPSSLQVFLSGVATTAVVHAAANSQDGVDYYEKFLKVSNTPDGPATYREGVDWRHNPDYGNDQIDWSRAANQPAAGATYYVTVTSILNANPTSSYTLRGNTITFASAPAANQAVFVQYVYGTHSANGATLAYQQTSAGDGGFNSIFIDDDYSARYLGKHIAMGLDWLDGYVGLSASLKQEARDLLVRWSDNLRDNSYLNNHPESNMETGSYVARVLTALALEGRDGRAPRLISQVLAYRQGNVVPLLTNPTTSLNGGFWAEGWNYGQNATQNLLLASLALEDNGLVKATAERAWASDVVDSLVSAQPATDQVYDGGDWYIYPTRFLDKGLFYYLSDLADRSTERAYANYILQDYPGASFANPADTGDYRDLLFHDPTAPAAFWSALPLEHYASGTGLVTARSDWGGSPSWVSVQMGNLLGDPNNPIDHQTNAPGQVQISRGDDQLLIDTMGAATAGESSLSARIGRSQYANIVSIDDNGDGVERVRGATGQWYGSPGVVVNAYEAADNHLYISGDYRAAYSPDFAPGSGGPASELTRQVVYLRPDFVVVYDRVTTLKAGYAKQLRWHFANAPVVQGNTFVETAGGSKLFGASFSSVPLTTTLAKVAIDGDTGGGGLTQVERVTTQNAAPTASVRYVTAFQIAPASTPQMVATERLTSTDGRMEGVRMADQVVLFGRQGAVDPSSAVAYQLPGGTFHNLLTDLQPGRSYQVTVNGVVATVTASTQGTLTFTTTGTGPYSVQVS
jgi:hypothetical protein